MNAEQAGTPPTSPWGAAGAYEAVRQVAEVVGHVTSRQVPVASDRRSFRSTDRTATEGILSVHGELADNDSHIVVRIEIARTGDGSRVALVPLVERLAALSDSAFLVGPRRAAGATDDVHLEIGLRVQASPMSVTRLAKLERTIREIHALAGAIQSDIPASLGDTELIARAEKVFEGLGELVTATRPATKPDDDKDPLALWALELLDLLVAGLSVAMVVSDSVTEEYALSQVSRAAALRGIGLGRLMMPAINAKAVAELARKVPGGFLVVPAMRMSLGTSPYEMAGEVRALLNLLSSAATPVLFTGTFAELQTVFASGQGCGSDPLAPVLAHVPTCPLDRLIGFAIESGGRLCGGMPPAVVAELRRLVGDALTEGAGASARRLLPPTALHAVRTWLSAGKLPTPEQTSSFVRAVSSLRATLVGGRPGDVRTTRSPELEQRFREVVLGQGLLSRLKADLLGQDAALEQLVERLQREALTRPAYQPLRWCAQGTPGTGKSESARLVAASLGVPYHYIDAASLADRYTANSQLFGSGRGLVGSYEPGRLERAAKQHGAVIEIADLDHAPPSVSAGLSDAFLQLLESGEAQSATGATFSAADLVLVFTLNLPDGADETVRRGVGFGAPPSDDEVTRRVTAEMRNVLSGAFLSRIGTPVLFAPLDRHALGLIVERAIRAALVSAGERLHLVADVVVIQEGLGDRAVAKLRPAVMAQGARGLLDLARGLAAEAIVSLARTPPAGAPQKLLVSLDASGCKLAVNVIGA